MQVFLRASYKKPKIKLLMIKLDQITFDDHASDGKLIYSDPYLRIIGTMVLFKTSPSI